MPIGARYEVHVNDIGTLYRARVWDEAVPFDPSLAIVKELIFDLPNGGRVVKAATLVAEGSPAAAWFLTYRIQPGDGGGSPATEFHAIAGLVQMQARLAWDDGTDLHSDIRTTDEFGHELRIHRNL